MHQPNKDKILELSEPDHDYKIRQIEMLWNEIRKMKTDLQEMKTVVNLLTIHRESDHD